MSELDNKVYIELGKNVKAKRQELGLSLRQLAALCDTEHAKISAIEGGKLNFRFSTILKIAKGLDTPLNELFKPY